MADKRRDNRGNQGAAQKLTGVQMEKLGIRPMPLYINWAIFKKTDRDREKLANAKLLYKANMKKDPSRNRMLQDQLANEMLTSGTPRWGAFSLNGHSFGY